MFQICFNSHFFSGAIADNHYPSIKPIRPRYYQISMSEGVPHPSNLKLLFKQLFKFKKLLKAYGIDKFVKDYLIKLKIENNPLAPKIFSHNLLNLSQVLISIEMPTISKSSREGIFTMRTITSISDYWHYYASYYDCIGLDASSKLSFVANGMAWNILNNETFQPMLEDVKPCLDSLDDIIQHYPSHKQVQSILQQLNSTWLMMLKNMGCEQDRRTLGCMLYPLLKDEITLPRVFREFIDALDPQDKKEFYDFLFSDQKQNLFLIDLLILYSEAPDPEPKFNLICCIIFHFKRHLLQGDEGPFFEPFIEIMNWILSTKPNVRYIYDTVTFKHKFSEYCRLPYLKRKEAVPKEILDLYNRIVSLDQGFSEELEYRKLLAHMFGIDGFSYILDQKAELHGMASGLLPDMLDYLTFLKNKALDSLKPDSHFHQIASQLRGIQAEPSFFSDIFSDLKIGHSMSIVRYGSVMMIGNQGSGCGELPGILVFRVDPSQFQTWNFEHFQVMEQRTADGYTIIHPDFFNQPCFRNMSAKLIGYIYLPYQIAGNCTWKGFKLRIFSEVFLSLAYEKLKTKPFLNVLIECIDTCKFFTTFLTRKIKKAVLKEYEDMHKGSQLAFKPDLNLMRSIEENQDGVKVTNKKLKDHWKQMTVLRAKRLHELLSA